MSFSMKDMIEPSQPQPQSQSQATAPAQQPTSTVVNATPSSPKDPNSFSMSDLVAGDEQKTQSTVENDPGKTGEITNDVGNTVIVPKDGESFSDTLKRAVAHNKAMTPEQQQAAIDKETATMPKKTAQTLGAAATIGAVGPALLAAPGEIVDASGALYDLAVKHLAGNVLPGMEEEAAKAKLLELAPKVYKAAKELGIAGTGLTLLWKAVADHK
jgi:hypothetical protein